MSGRTVELLSLLVVFLAASIYATSEVNLLQYLKDHQKIQPAEKRKIQGNPCPNPEKPFPCKSKRCIAMGYVCDDNIDCEDGFDEDTDMCTAAHRPPVEDIIHFVEAEQDWLIPNIFGGKNVYKIAHALAVSHSMRDFAKRANLTPDEVENLHHALDAAVEGNEYHMEQLGMPSSAWNDVEFFFNKLIKSGFGNK